MKRKPMKVILLGIASFLLTVLTFFFGAPFIRTLRQGYPALLFWGFGLLFSFFAGPLWILIAIPWFTVGLEVELEKRGQRYDKASLYSVLAVVFLMVAGFYVAQAMGVPVTELFKEQLQLVLQRFKELGADSKLTVDDIIPQIPAAVITALIMILTTAMGMDRMAHHLFRVPFHRSPSQGDYMGFKVPSWAFWISLMGMAMALAAPLNPRIGTVGYNLVNIYSTIYFIQGVIIMEAWLRKIQASWFMRMSTYFLVMATPLFLGVVIVGFVDFWFDFRVRIQNLSSLNTNNKM